ncbi:MULTISPECIES: hypothetical protein [unclassified Curtobacterium]|uniref:hypothetical protein n=1 Tax=unclassified Curtobacterium TaxID=257496 RepID=UPI000DA98682|nr:MULTISPECIES: hypothetical protein [unclassified Curtobacterium]PZE28658.1 hypothetical protein DEI86_02400 [Curtobacterium sp. MCBD17_028]PZF65032.1 hypothetical protein DEI81_02640 [Curtobacterium sp. MCBD17_013]WIB65087.1 hypothetical protein DEI94_07855 [Curtobacterium sp. MCBD17_040]WIE56105.1 hypothetical protein DEI88_007915 [Curtobacterium sp. MCBD17_003]
MSKRTYAQHLQAMIERAGSLTAQEAEALGRLWKADEDIVLPEPSWAFEIQGGIDVPVVTNVQLVAAWEHALHAAGTAGRVDEIEAAQDAGRAAARDLRHIHDDELAEDGAQEAVRSAVLAAGVRDLIPDDEYQTLTTAWRRVLGELPA